MKENADEDGEAELVIMRPKDKQSGRIGLYLDGQKAASLREGDSVKLIVKQGDHTLFAEWEGKEEALQGNTLTFAANLDRTVFRTTFNNRSLTLLLEGKTALRPAGGTGTVRSQLDTAIDQAFGVIEGSLTGIKIPEEKDRLTIAIMDISSSDAAQSDYVVSGLIERFVGLRKYNVVERSRLDTVKKEIQTQYSGDVDDGSLAGIGKQFGASVVITGSITREGATSVLEIRAINVETAAILQIVRPRF
jgi:co-chaperonin GroES (HSP10)/TolB-like protein